MAVRQYFAFADDIGPITNAQGFAHIVIRDQYTDVAAFQKMNDALDFNHGDGVDARKGLIQQNKAWASRQRTRGLVCTAGPLPVVSEPPQPAPMAPAPRSKVDFLTKSRRFISDLDLNSLNDSLSFRGPQTTPAIGRRLSGASSLDQD